MLINRYVLLANRAVAQDFIDAINQIVPGNWHWPIVHPFEEAAIVPWNDEYLKPAANLLEGKTTFSHHEAIRRGWALGYFNGRFWKARSKMEEALFAYDVLAAIEATDLHPNFPAYKSMFYGVLVALYGVKEGLHHACKKISPAAHKWWKEQFNHIQRDPVLKLMYDLHNVAKHELTDSTLGCESWTNMQSIGDHVQMVADGGGYNIINKGTSRERRVFAEGVRGWMRCYLAMPDRANLPATATLEQALGHYQDMIWEARQQFGDYAGPDEVVPPGGVGLMRAGV